MLHTNLTTLYLIKGSPVDLAISMRAYELAKEAGRGMMIDIPDLGEQ